MPAVAVRERAGADAFERAPRGGAPRSAARRARMPGWRPHSGARTASPAPSRRSTRSRARPAPASPAKPLGPECAEVVDPAAGCGSRTRFARAPSVSGHGSRRRSEQEGGITSGADPVVDPTRASAGPGRVPEGPRVVVQRADDRIGRKDEECRDGRRKDDLRQRVPRPQHEDERRTRSRRPTGSAAPPGSHPARGSRAAGAESGRTCPRDRDVQEAPEREREQQARPE